MCSVADRNYFILTENPKHYLCEQKFAGKIVPVFQLC